MAPAGWEQPWHGSTRHAFWQTGHACSSMPCWALSCRNCCWSGIHTVPLHSMLQAWDTGLLWGAKQGPKDSEKYEISKKMDVLSMYFQCICDVLTMYFVCIGYVLTGNYRVCTDKKWCILHVLPMYCQCIQDVLWRYYLCISHVLWMYWKLCPTPLFSPQYVLEMYLIRLFQCIGHVLTMQYIPIHHRGIGMYYKMY
jgi:hypothetical protein